jgi:hypothetical protein
MQHEGSRMKNGNWQTTILSDPEHEHLVAEMSFGGQFLLLLDREQGRENVCVSFPVKDGAGEIRVPLADFVAQLQAAAADLCR